MAFRVFVTILAMGCSPLLFSQETTSSQSQSINGNQNRSSYAVGWQVGGGRQSILELSNSHSNKPERVHLTVWSQLGEIIGDHYVTVPALRTSSINMETIIDRGVSATGTVEMQTKDISGLIQANLRITDATAEKSWSVPATAGYLDNDRSSLHAAWPSLGKGSTVHLSLYNSGNQLLTVSRGGSGEMTASAVPMKIAPHQTVEVEIPDDHEVSSISRCLLDYDGPLSSLHATLLQGEKNSKTRYYVPFSVAHATATTGSLTWIFPPSMEPGVTKPTSATSGRTQKLFLVNWSTVSAPISVRNLSQPLPTEDLGVPPLGPGEARIVDVPIDAASRITSGLVVGTQGKVGTVTVALIYADQDLGYKDWMSGSVIPKPDLHAISWGSSRANMVIDGLLSTQPDEKFDLVLLYQDSSGVGQYKKMYSEDHSQSRTRLSLRELVRNGIPDDDMRVLAAATASGIAVVGLQNSLSSVEPTIGPECAQNCGAVVQSSNGGLTPSQVEKPTTAAAPLAVVSAQTPPTLAHPDFEAPPPCTVEPSPANACPSTITVGAPIVVALEPMVPPLLTGVGIVVPMTVGPAGNWRGTQLTETVSRSGGSCPASFACNGGGHFVVGDGGKVQIKVSPTTTLIGPTVRATKNVFYDEHLAWSTANVLVSLNLQACDLQCTQTYSCNGVPVGTPVTTFTIERNLTMSTVGNTAVTRVTTTKQ